MRWTRLWISILFIGACTMATTYREPTLDPVDNSAAAYYHYRSTSKGGAGTDIVGIDDLTVPAALNFPPADSDTTPTRAFIYFEWILDATDLAGTRPTVIRNETQGFDLVRIDSTATLTNKTFKIFPDSSYSRNVIEVHIGTVGNSTVLGDSLSIEGYSVGTTIDSDRINNVDAVSLKISDTTDSTTKDTGSIVTEGGIGAEKSIVSGDDITATNDLGFYGGHKIRSGFTSSFSTPGVSSTILSGADWGTRVHIIWNRGEGAGNIQQGIASFLSSGVTSTFLSVNDVNYLVEKDSNDNIYFRVTSSVGLVKIQWTIIFI
jgi:hypothetical protein